MTLLSAINLALQITAKLITLSTGQDGKGKITDDSTISEIETVVKAAHDLIDHHHKNRS